jgi:hypothetical protein
MGNCDNRFYFLFKKEFGENMRKKGLVLVVSFIMVFALAGCDILGGLLGGLLGGKTEGEIGTTLKTAWFDFTVNSAEKADSYADYTAAEGNKLVVVEVTETNTSSDELPMSTFDFMLDDPADTEYYVDAMAPLDSSMMPEKFYLSVGETVTYALVFKVPATSSNFTLTFIEYGIDSSGNETTGDTFKVALGF